MAQFGLPELIVPLVLVVFGYFIVGRIFSKAGYSPWLGLVMIIPLLNLAVLIWFAFADWPATRK